MPPKLHRSAPGQLMTLKQERTRGSQLDGQSPHIVSNEKRAPGWLGYIRDDKLPSYIGVIRL